MLTALAITALAILSSPGMDLQISAQFDTRSEGWESDTDTTFEVRPGARLEVRNHAGEIVVRTWKRDAVRVQASHSRDDRVKIHQSGSVVTIKSEARYGLPDVVDYEITVPASMALDLSGVYTDVQVDGARNGVTVETLSGDVEIRGCQGELSLRSIEGEITLQASKGRVEANSVEDDITLTGVEGEIFVESIDGDIRLEGVRSNHVEASTVDGDVRYSGSIDDDGRYRLTTHDGDVVLEISDDVNATVSVATFDGEFLASFPIELSGLQAGRKFSFVLGDGGAQVELHSFDGDIHLVRR